MFKGIIALFTSGLIFNPMVLGGIVLGGIILAKVEEKQLFSFYKDYHFYLFALFLSFLYNVFFKRVYNDGGNGLDWKNMAANILGGAFLFVFSSLMMISFVWMISF